MEQEKKQVQTYRYNNFLGGWSPQPIEKAGLGQMQDWLNFRINRQGYLEPRKGYAKVGSSNMGGNCMGLGYHYGGGAVGPFWIFATSAGKIYRVPNDGTYTAAEIQTGMSGSYLWNFIEYDDATPNPIVIALNGSNAPQKVVKAGTCGSLGGSPYSGAHGIVHKGCVFIAHPSNPNIWFSGQLTPEVVSANSPMLPPVGSNEHVTGIASSGGVPIVFYHDSIWAIYGNTPAEFYAVKRADLGCGWRRSVASNGQDIFFVATGGHVMRFNYSGGLENIGREIHSSIRETTGAACRGIWNPISREYWLSINEGDSSVPTHTYVWNEEGYWIRYNIPMQSGIYIERYSIPGETQGKLFLGLANANYLYSHDPDGSVTQDDGVDLVCSVKTPWTMYGAADAMKRTSWYDVVGNVSSATTFSFKTHYRNIPRGSATMVTDTHATTTLPQNKALTNTIEAREFCHEFTGNQKTFLDEIAVGVEITRYDRRT